MRRPRTALYLKQDQWEGITGNLGKRLEELPHLKGLYDALVAKFKESRTLEGQIAILRGNLEDALKRLDQVAAEGEQIRGRLTAALQAEFGFDSSHLHEFGLRPRRTRRRRKKEPEAAPEAVSPKSPE
jgi:hypothetical protein